MELTTILGIIMGVGTVIGAMFLKGVPLSAFNNPAAIVVIFVGTVATILNSFRGKDLKNIGKLFKLLFTSKKSNEAKVIEELLSLAAFVRKEGILALEAKLANVEDPFLSKALGMIVDGVDEEYAYDVLTAEVDAMKERHNSNASIFSSAGTYAPTLGVLGAVFGLIAAMSDINNTENMSHAIAAAFMATILGIFTGYVLWNPFATKLKMKSKQEAFEKMLIIEGVLSIQKGDHPVRIKEKLIALFPAKQQQKLETDISAKEG